jgi:hypothetical protein
VLIITGAPVANLPCRFGGHARLARQPSTTPCGDTRSCGIGAMSGILYIGLGGALGLTACLLPRHVTEARRIGLPTLLLDLSPVVVGGSLLLVATRRAIVSGLVLLAIGARFALADQTKREVLREPVVFPRCPSCRRFSHVLSFICRSRARRSSSPERSRQLRLASLCSTWNWDCGSRNPY